MKRIVAALFAAIFAASCAPNTPDARIQREPGKFAALPARDQELVRDGRIARGMNTDAVYFAWGTPARVMEGTRDGRPSERWTYMGSRPVHGSAIHGGFGRCPHGWWGGGWFGAGPDVFYVPYQTGDVLFIDKRVDSWERER